MSCFYFFVLVNVGPQKKCLVCKFCNHFEFEAPLVHTQVVLDNWSTLRNYTPWHKTTKLMLLS